MTALQAIYPYWERDYNSEKHKFSAKTIKKIVDITKEYEKKFGIEIYIISDEPYRYLEYENNEQPFITSIFERGIIATSFSKDLSLAGERIGFIAINPQNKNKDILISALNFSVG